MWERGYSRRERNKLPMKIARKHIVAAIERHQELFERYEIPPSRHYVTIWEFKKYRLSVKTLPHGWRVLWYKPKRKKN